MHDQNANQHPKCNSTKVLRYSRNPHAGQHEAQACQRKNHYIKDEAMEERCDMVEIRLELGCAALHGYSRANVRR